MSLFQGSRSVIVFFAALFFGAAAMALVVDVNVVASYIAPLVGTFAAVIPVVPGNSAFFTGSASYTSCANGSALYLTDGNVGTLNFTATDINQDALYWHAVVGSTDVNLVPGQSSYSVPYSGVQAFCLRGDVRRFGHAHINISDINVNVTG